MKKVLLLAAIAFGFNAFSQDAMTDKLLQTEITPNAAAKEKIEDIILKRGGAINNNYDRQVLACRRRRLPRRVAGRQS